MYTAPRRWMTDEIAALGELATSFFTNEALPHVERWHQQQHVDREFWHKAGEVGLLSCSVPAEYGGAGGTIAHDLAVLDAQCRVTDYSFGGSVHSGIVTHYLLTYGTEEQKQRWLPAMVTGEVVAAMAMTEPDAGSDLQAMRTRAERTADGWLVNGTKTFITNGTLADLVLLAAVTDPGKGARGISLLLVDTQQDGYRVAGVLDKIGQHGADTSELVLTDVHLSSDALLGAEGRGFPMMMEQLPQERLILGTMGVGSMCQALDATIDYTTQRKVFGRRVADLQNSRFELAECATLVEAARALVDDAILRHLGGTLDTAGAAMVKSWVSKVQGEVTDRCLQLFGGYGYMREYPIGQMWIDARAQRIYAGTNEIMKELIARSLVGRVSN